MKVVCTFAVVVALTVPSVAKAHVPPQCEPDLAAVEAALDDASPKIGPVSDSAMAGMSFAQRGEAVPPLTYAEHVQALGEFLIALGGLMNEGEKFIGCVNGQR